MTFSEDLTQKTWSAVSHLRQRGFSWTNRASLWSGITPNFDLPGAPSGADRWFVAEHRFYALCDSDLSISNFLSD